MIPIHKCNKMQLIIQAHFFIGTHNRIIYYMVIIIDRLK